MNYYVSGHAVNLMNVDSIITCEQAHGIQSAAISYFRELGYQAISAIHVPKIKGDHIHFHMAINTVNLYTGQKYSGTYTQQKEFFEY